MIPPRPRAFDLVEHGRVAHVGISGRPCLAMIRTEACSSHHPIWTGEVCVRSRMPVEVAVSCMCGGWCSGMLTPEVVVVVFTLDLTPR